MFTTFGPKFWSIFVFVFEMIHQVLEFLTKQRGGVNNSYFMTFYYQWINNYAYQSNYVTVNQRAKKFIFLAHCVNTIKFGHFCYKVVDFDSKLKISITLTISFQYENNMKIAHESNTW